LTKKRHCPICGSGDYNYPSEKISPAYMFCSNCGVDTKRLEDYRKLELGDRVDPRRFYLRRDPVERFYLGVQINSTTVVERNVELFYYKVSGLLLLEYGGDARRSISDRELEHVLESSYRRDLTVGDFPILLTSMIQLAEFRVFLKKVRNTEKYLSQLFLDRQLKLTETVLTIQ
jgi:hypothetical protein